MQTRNVQGKIKKKEEIINKYKSKERKKKGTKEGEKADGNP
jgi:hypothetical protein